MSSFSQLLKQTKPATAFTRVAAKSCHQTSHYTHLVIESILAWISLSVASEFVSPALSNFSKHCWVSCTSRFVWWYRGSITPPIWMQYTLYKLSGVHMLLPSGGDIRAIRVTHAWELRARLQPVTCRATSTIDKSKSTANYDVTHEPSGSLFLKFYRKNNTSAARSLVIFVTRLRVRLCLLRSVAIGYGRWYRDLH